MKKRILALALALLLTAGLSLNAFAGARDVASAYRTRISPARIPLPCSTSRATACPSFSCSRRAPTV